MIRDFNPLDLERLEEINNKLNLFELPDQIHVAKTVEIDGVIVGSVMGKLVMDVSLVVDPSLGRLTRARLIQEMVESLHAELKRLKVTEVQAFCLTEELPQLLTNKFGFKRLEGIPIGRNV